MFPPKKQKQSARLRCQPSDVLPPGDIISKDQFRVLSLCFGNLVIPDNSWAAHNFCGAEAATALAADKTELALSTFESRVLGNGMGA